ncbi:MAG: Hpt domain-containing protein [Pseudomonadota bacterium]
MYSTQAIGAAPDAAIDMSHLDKYTCGDGALLDEILGLFVEHSAKCVAGLSVDADDNVWRDGCHGLKGTARGVGAWALGQKAAEGEGLIGDLPAKREVREKLLASIRNSAREAIDYAEMLRVRATEKA